MHAAPDLPLIVPQSGMPITRSARLAPGVHLLPDGLDIAADGVTLDGRGAVLVGRGAAGSGIRIAGRRDVTVQHCVLRDYYHGIVAADSAGLALVANEVRATAEVPANTIFLDIWKPASESYGGGIFLQRVRDTRIEGNDLQHQMNGLLTYECQRLAVRDNLANFNSGFGIHLYATCDSRFERNFADCCCRYEPRGPRAGHIGADAAGFLIVYRSCRNVFCGNFARLSGDGFFLAGLSPELEPVGCDDNLFEENDGSLSPNIAFEATFSRGNVFRDNRADYCNFGFWLGYSAENTLENNRLLMNRQAGVAVEHGRGMVVRGNQFHGNGHGIRLWTLSQPALLRAFPDRATSRDWLIEKNSFIRNAVGVRIAADQDHGLRNADPLPAERCRPCDHVIRANEFCDNRIAVDLLCADRTTIQHNTFSGNVEANIRESDCRETVTRPNLGVAGAYIL